MDQNAKESAENVLHGLHSKQINKEVKEIRLQEKDPLFSLKTVLYSFFKKRLSIIEAESNFKEIVKDAIEQKIVDSEISIAQLITLYDSISSQSTFATNSILDIFKPGKDGSVSPIVTGNKNDESISSTIPEFGNLTPQEAEALNSLSGILKKLKNQTKIED